MSVSKSFRNNGIVACIVMSLVGLATAGPVCKVPPEKWMKEGDFRFNLKRQGYLIKTIKKVNGCYEVYGLDPFGQRIQILFNPETAMPLVSN
jgi:hypothetical protein